jgi:hypothetical protein
MEVGTSQVTVFEIRLGKVGVFEIAALQGLAMKIESDKPGSGKILAGESGVSMIARRRSRSRRRQTITTSAVCQERAVTC